MRLGSVLQIPYLCINGGLKMKRDNLVGGWRLFRRTQGGAPLPLAFGEGRDRNARTSQPDDAAGEHLMLNRLSFSSQESFRFYADKLKADKDQMAPEE